MALVLSLFIVGCEEEEEIIEEIFGSALNENYVGDFSGSGDAFLYDQGDEHVNKDAYANVVLQESGYRVQVRVVYNCGLLDPCSARITFFTESGNVDYRQGSKRYVGNVSFGSNSNSGNIDVRQVNTDGSEVPYRKIVWNCSRD